jgi:hypothetical protein
MPSEKTLTRLFHRLLGVEESVAHKRRDRRQIMPGVSQILVGSRKPILCSWHSAGGGDNDAPIWAEGAPWQGSYKNTRCRTLGSLRTQLRNLSSIWLSARVSRSC